MHQPLISQGAKSWTKNIVCMREHLCVCVCGMVGNILDGLCNVSLDGIDEESFGCVY